MTKRILALALAGLMCFGLLAGCGNTATETTPVETTPVETTPVVEDTTFDMSVCIASEPQTIDPALNSAVDGAIMVQHMFEGLMKWADSTVPVEGCTGVNLAELVPGQAESYEKTVNEDGTVTYTFTLRDGIKWTDGQAVTAGDFVYAWQRLATPETAADYCYMIDMIKGYAEVNAGEADPSTLGVTAVDDKTFVVELTSDCPYVLEEHLHIGAVDLGEVDLHRDGRPGRRRDDGLRRLLHGVGVPLR